MNLGRLGDKRKRYLYAMPSPQSIAKYYEQGIANKLIFNDATKVYISHNTLIKVIGRPASRVKELIFKRAFLVAKNHSLEKLSGVGLLLFQQTVQSS